MINNKNKKLIIYLSLLGLLTALALTLSICWQPFKYEKMSTYSSGLVGTYFYAHQANETTQAVLTVVAFGAAIVISYLLGSINFAIITSRELFGQDVRKYGSKNAGMTNVIRVYGFKAGLYTLLGDALKTSSAVFVCRLIGGEPVAYLGAMFCVLGHVAPIKYKFKGGKGVLSSAIAILCLDPMIFLFLIALFALVLLIWRYVSLASVISAFAYPGLVIFFANNRFGTPPNPIVLIFALFVGLFIIFTHRSNLQRISERTENKFSFKKKNKE